MKPRHSLLIAGLAIAAWLALFGDKTPAGATVEPMSRAQAPALGNATAPANNVGVVRGAASIASTKGERDWAILALQPRGVLIGGQHNKKAADILFSSQTWTPPPTKPSPLSPLSPPSPATAPPLPFTYLGKKIEDSVWEVYLGRGDQTFIVRAQTTIEGAYRVDSINPPVLSLTYLPSNQVQTLAIGGLD